MISKLLMCSAWFWLLAPPIYTMGQGLIKLKSRQQTPGDPELARYIQKIMSEEYRTLMRKGSSEMDIPILDSLQLPNFTYSSPRGIIQYDIEIGDFQIPGLSSYRTRNVTANPGRRQLNVWITYPGVIQGTGTYTLMGSIFGVVMRYQGDMMIKVHDAEVKIYGHLRKKRPEREMYLRRVRMEMREKKVEFVLANFPAGPLLTRFINAKAIFQDVKPLIIEILSDAWVKKINQTLPSYVPTLPNNQTLPENLPTNTDNLTTVGLNNSITSLDKLNEVSFNRTAIGNVSENVAKPTGSPKPANAPKPTNQTPITTIKLVASVTNKTPTANYSSTSFPNANQTLTVKENGTSSTRNVSIVASTSPTRDQIVNVTKSKNITKASTTSTRKPSSGVSPTTARGNTTSKAPAKVKPTTTKTKPTSTQAATTRRPSKKTTTTTSKSPTTETSLFNRSSTLSELEITSEKTNIDTRTVNTPTSKPKSTTLSAELSTTEITSTLRTFVKEENDNAGHQKLISLLKNSTQVTTKPTVRVTTNQPFHKSDNASSPTPEDELKDALTTYVVGNIGSTISVKTSNDSVHEETTTTHDEGHATIPVKIKRY